MNTYRITFLHSMECDYWGTNKRKLQAESYLNFNDVHKKYYSLVKEIKESARNLGIKNFWHFYEPHIEITWLSDEEQARELYIIIEGVLTRENIIDAVKEQGMGADWFCCNDREREFGAKRHALSSDFVDLIQEYEKDIQSGKGVHAQVGRTIHTICNPLGINYIDEAKICFSRGLICVLFRYFSFNKAVWIYRNIFIQKY